MKAIVNKPRKYVTISCYGQESVKERNNAIRTYTTYIAASEGSERDRYVSILLQLQEGKNYCTDEI